MRNEGGFIVQMTKQFTRTVEDFTCEHCGHEVKGTGYTNHCPACLWSKHVDVNPGDRQAECLGMMEPISIEQKRGDFVIVQRCQSCGHVRKNKAAPEDDMDEIIRISSHGIQG